MRFMGIESCRRRSRSRRIQWRFAPAVAKSPNMTAAAQSSRLARFLGANLVLLVAQPAHGADASPGTAASARGASDRGRTAWAPAFTVPHRATPCARLENLLALSGRLGIPPRFDFSGSRNVKSVSVRYPAPQRLTDESGTSIGYQHDLVFPLDVVPQEAGKPLVLALKADYAICEKICIPVEGKAELTLTASPGAHRDKLTRSELLVPKPAAVGDDGPLSIRAAKRQASRVIVDVAASSHAPVELFAEGPTPDWALPVPSPIAGAPAGQQRFAFALDGLPPNTKPEGATLTLTAVAGERASRCVPARLMSQAAKLRQRIRPNP